MANQEYSAGVWRLTSSSKVISRDGPGARLCPACPVVCCVALVWGWTWTSPSPSDSCCQLSPTNLAHLDVERELEHGAFVAISC